MKIQFTHRQSAHCETGVTSNLLYHYGIKDISEAAVFGIGAGIFFAYLPFIKINYLPLTTFRAGMGGIMNRTLKRLGVQVKWEKFRSPEKAMAALDRMLEQNTPVGCRTGAYWLPFFPPAFRFHFNMHNLVVYGKEGDDYLISDPVFPEPVTCPAKDLQKARFAQGALAPKGRMYYIIDVGGGTPDYPKAFLKGIKETCRIMLKTPGPLIGVKGIRFLARQMEKWPEKLGERKASLYMGQLIRMQEEIGTGGAGFRFVYAAFLQEAAGVLADDRFTACSEQMTAIGDQWRSSAVIGARICKNRASSSESYASAAAILKDCADMEEALFKELAAIIREK